MFQKPNYDRDKELLQQEKKKSTQGFDWDSVFFRCKDKHENWLRVLPARSENPKAGWHLRIAKHWIKHPDSERKEVFICMQDVYGEPCPSCERFQELIEDDKKEAFRYSPKKLGVFNVLDREQYAAYLDDSKKNKLPKVRLYESAFTVWEEIVGIVSRRGQMSNLFDEFNEKGNLIPGRDIIIYYDSDKKFREMYSVQATDALPLGEPEEIEEWYKQIVDLVPEEISFYSPIDYETARIKCFGTFEEREELKEQLRKEYEERAEEEKEEEEKPKAKKKSGGMKEKLEAAKKSAKKEKEEEDEEKETEEPTKDEPEEVEKDETEETDEPEEEKEDEGEEIGDIRDKIKAMASKKKKK